MGNILIIEDNLMSIEIAGELLKRAGHSILEAENAFQGIEIARLKKPDLIVMDLDLPEMDGFATTKILKKDPVTQNIPVIAFSALVMESDKKKAFHAGCLDFITKPIDISSFVFTVEKHLKNKNKYIKNDSSLYFEINKPEQKQQNLTKYCPYKSHEILIVDDNFMNAELLKGILDQIGQKSSIAYGGKEALKAIEQQNFDLILLDIMMPEISGFELIKHIKNNTKTNQIPVIFISALNETSDIIKGLKLGSYDYITKPYNIEELKARILTTLRIKDLQDELKAERDKLDLIFRFSADGIVMLDSDFKIISCNDQFISWLGVSENQIKNKDFCLLMNCPNYEKHRKQAFLNCQNLITELNLQENKKILQVNHSKININNSSLQGYVLVLRDISAYKQIEKQKETFVAMLTHDLKTPIRAEMRALELLLKGSFGHLTDIQENITKDILCSSKYMFNMVDNLLSTYKYENGSIIIKKDYANIKNLVKDCCNELKYIISDKKQEVILDFDSADIIIRLDILEIKRVIMNLLSNAINYTHERSKIIIKIENDNDTIKVSFIDNGKGISQKELTGLFNRYTSYAKKFRQVGTGLGLYLSRQIIEAHNGKIFVESTEGKGSCFSFILPKF